MSEPQHGPHDHGDRPAFLQHHFDTPLQQFDSGKLGMWLFLATEVLLFGGLFVAYAVYRSNHPEVFAYSHHFLDYRLGALNTVILLCSSLTMAWGVRAAQLGQKKLLMTLLTLTLLGGCGFMVIKFVEYRAKFDHGTLWVSRYESQMGRDHGHDTVAGGAGQHGAAGESGSAEHPAGTEATAHGAAVASPGHGSDGVAGRSGPAAAAVPGGFKPERSVLPGPVPGPAGPAGVAGVETLGTPGEPHKVGVFWSIYFLMTGLHGAHVLIGMGAIGWVLWRASRNEFGPKYFTPVDLVGLYWHLVDLIWIFLFPLLYLIS